jgi:hypothetical protein
MREHCLHQHICFRIYTDVLHVVNRRSPDIIEGTPPFGDIEDAFGITFDDDAALELYDMDLDEAAVRILEIQRLQVGGEGCGNGCGMTTKRDICAELTALFRRNGCMRRHDAGRYATQGCMKYKKGEEIRLVANGREEQERILRRLKQAGFRAGRPFRKAPDRNQFCVPIYGREEVARFLRMVEETETCQPPGDALQRA